VIALARAVLFDLDDTLFDHHRSARAALAEVHRRHADATDFDSFERHHIRFLEEMHIEVLAGRVELNEARRERFRRVFRALGLQMSEADVDAVASAYRSGYVAARRPVFRLALDRLGVQASEAVMVGDSWAADIVGAARAGVRAIWFNPFRKAMPAEPAGVAEIHALAPAVDLLPLLLGAEHVGP